VTVLASLQRPCRPTSWSGSHAQRFGGAFNLNVHFARSCWIVCSRSRRVGRLPILCGDLLHAMNQPVIVHAFATKMTTANRRETTMPAHREAGLRSRQPYIRETICARPSRKAGLFA